MLTRSLRSLLLILTVAFAPSLQGGETPRRIVSLLPSHTDILAVLGVLDRVVGLSDAEDPRLLPGIPRVGGMDISWEALSRLKPDLILADVSHRGHDALFQRLRLPVVYLNSTRAGTLEDVFALVTETGRLVGREESAARWVADAARRVQEGDARRFPPPGPLVYFELWPQPLQACGPASLPGHLLARLGARNVVTETDQAAPLVSAEALVRADPDIILHTGVVSSADIAARPGWSGLRAVRQGRVFSVNVDDFSQAGPRALKALDSLAGLLGREGKP